MKPYMSSETIQVVCLTTLLSTHDIACSFCIFCAPVPRTSCQAAFNNLWMCVCAVVWLWLCDQTHFNFLVQINLTPLCWSEGLIKHFLFLLNHSHTHASATVSILFFSFWRCLFHISSVQLQISFLSCPLWIWRMFTWSILMPKRQVFL